MEFESWNNPILYPTTTSLLLQDLLVLCDNEHNYLSSYRSLCTQKVGIDLLQYRMSKIILIIHMQMPVNSLLYVTLFVDFTSLLKGIPFYSFI